MILKFSHYNESKFGNFKDNIQYTDWSDFKLKLKNAILTGFKNIDDLVLLMDMDLNIYHKIKDNMIFNWKDSVSKSILHSIAEIGHKIPKTGSNIFPDLKTQTQFLILSSQGYQGTNIFGNFNSANGLNILRKNSDLEPIINTDKKVDSRFVTFGGVNALTTKTEDGIKKVNDIIKYIWLYGFYNHYKLKKEKLKIPKYLYRGIRGVMYDKAKKVLGKEFEELNKLATETKMKNSKTVKLRYDLVFDYILKNGLHKLTDGKFLSFTSSLPIAKYFSNKDGFIIRVESDKVNIISSELTEELFNQEDYVSNKKEKEYIIVIPKNYKFTKDDIIITDEDYLIADNNPLCVDSFSHDNKQAFYDMLDDNGVLWHINAYYVWHTNDRGGILYSVKNDKGDDSRWGHTRNEIKKEYHFDPLPNEKNINKISNFSADDNKKRW
jgi:hypothetical protein